MKKWEPRSTPPDGLYVSGFSETDYLIKISGGMAAWVEPAEEGARESCVHKLESVDFMLRGFNAVYGPIEVMSEDEEKGENTMTNGEIIRKLSNVGLASYIFMRSLRPNLGCQPGDYDEHSLMWVTHEADDWMKALFELEMERRPNAKTCRHKNKR